MTRGRIVATLLLCATLTACSSGAHPAPPASTAPSTPRSPSTAPSTPAPTSSPSEPRTTGPNVRPGEKPPVLPAAAREHTSTGALLAAGFYFRAFDWGYATNDPFLVEQISSQRCAACASYARGIDTLVKSGGHVQGGRVTVLSTNLIDADSFLGSEYTAEISLDEEPVVLSYPSQPTRTAQPAAQHLKTRVYVAWSDGGWRVVAVTQ